MTLSSSQLDTIAREVYRQFPELHGARPSMQAQLTAGVKSTGGDKARLLITFRGSVRGPDGRALNRIVRVVADERGRILKMSTSK